MRCPTCDHVFLPGERFCPHCGSVAPVSKLGGGAVPPPPPPQGMPPVGALTDGPYVPLTAGDTTPYMPPDGEETVPFASLAPTVDASPGAGPYEPITTADANHYPVPPSQGAAWPRPAGGFSGDRPPLVRPTDQPASNRAIMLALLTALTVVGLLALIIMGAGDVGPFAGLFYQQSSATSPTTSGSTSATHPGSSTAPPTAPPATRVPAPTATSAPAPTVVPAPAPIPTATPQPAPTATSAPAPIPAPIATPAPALACGAALGGSGAPNAGGSFGDLPFPAGATSTSPTQDSAGAGRFTVAHITACAPNTSAQNLVQYYSAAMAQHGWGGSPLFKVPYDGGYFVHCTGWLAGLCWMKGATPRFVSLENVADQGNGIVLYRLDLFAPPPAPQCAGSFAGVPYQEFWVVSNPQSLYVALPPLSRAYAVPGTSSVPPHVAVCSAGTASSVQSYLTTTLPHQLWSPQGSQSGYQVWTAQNYTLAYSVSSPTSWNFGYGTTATHDNATTSTNTGLLLIQPPATTPTQAQPTRSPHGNSHGNTYKHKAHRGRGKHGHEQHGG